MTKPVTIYHNPNCGTSRTALSLIRDRGIEPTIVEYMKTPLTREQIDDLIDRSCLTIRDFLRTKEKLYSELELANPKWTDEQLTGFLADNPALLNRPVVETKKGIRSCRPADTVLDLLD